MMFFVCTEISFPHLEKQQNNIAGVCDPPVPVHTNWPLRQQQPIPEVPPTFFHANRPLHQQRPISEVPPGFEPGNKGFADLRLTAWLWHRKKMER